MKKIFAVFFSIVLSFTIANFAKAQTSAAPFLCETNSYKTIVWAVKQTNGSYACPTSYNSANVVDSVPTTDKSVCVITGVYTGVSYIKKLDDAQSCNKYKDQGNVTLTTISSTPTVTPIPNPQTPTTPTTNTTNTRPPTTNTRNTTTRPPTNVTKNPTTGGSQGSCPDGFTEKGPLCVPNNPFGDSGGIASNGTIGGIANTIINIMLSLAGIVAVFMLIIGGYQWMTARGNESQVTNGRKTVINALIGLAIVILSFAIVSLVNSFLNNGLG
jgi:hypothetical protein